MTQKPAAAQRISVVIPLYNAVRHLRPCLESVLNQTHRELEILVVDSGSTDGSLDVVRELAARDARIRLIQPGPTDVSAARNVGVSEAAGDWIAFSDSDDLVPANAYELLLNAALAQNCAMALGAYRECHYETRPRFVRPVSAKPFVCHSAAEAQRYFLTSGKYLTHMWSKLFRRDVFEDVAFPVGRIYEDMAVMPRLIDNARSLVVVNQCVYHYLIHAGSLSNAINIPKQMTGLDVRLDYAAYIAEHYPELLPLANDAVLSIGCNMLAKIWHIGIEKAPDAWERTVHVMQETAPKAALQDPTYRYIAKMLPSHPEALARSVHLLLHMDGML